MASQDATIAGFDRSAKLSQAAVRDLVLQAIQQLRDGIVRSEVDAALAERSAAPILESAAWATFAETILVAFSTLEDGPLFKTMKSAARRAASSSPLSSPDELNIELVYARAIEWLEREGARLVTAVTEGTRAAIRGVVQDAFAEPLGTRQAARRILEVKGFGLNNPQTRAFERYIGSLLTREIPGSENLTGKQIQRLIDVRYRKLRKDRARLIAKTESYNAAAAAQRELWSEAAGQGQLDPELYVLEWVTRVIRVCPRCIALSGKTAEINGGTFTSDTIIGGGRYDGTQIVVERPTVHPDCYCAMRVVRRHPAAAEASASAASVLIFLHEQTRGTWHSRGAIA